MCHFVSIWWSGCVRRHKVRWQYPEILCISIVDRFGDSVFFLAIWFQYILSIHSGLSAPVHFNETLFITSKIVGGSMQRPAHTIRCLVLTPCGSCWWGCSSRSIRLRWGCSSHRWRCNSLRWGDELDGWWSSSSGKQPSMQQQNHCGTPLTKISPMDFFRGRWGEFTFS